MRERERGQERTNGGEEIPGFSGSIFVPEKSSAGPCLLSTGWGAWVRFQETSDWKVVHITTIYISINSSRGRSVGSLNCYSSTCNLLKKQWNMASLISDSLWWKTEFLTWCDLCSNERRGICRFFFPISLQFSMFWCLLHYSWPEWIVEFKCLANLFVCKLWREKEELVVPQSFDLPLHFLLVHHFHWHKKEQGGIKERILIKGTLQNALHHVLHSLLH